MKAIFFDSEEIRGSAPTPRKPKRAAATGCAACGLGDSCQSPRMDPYGEGELRIVIVAEAPGQDEDREGIPLVGASGKFLRDRLEKIGVDMDRDCVRLNVVQCRPTQEVRGEVENRTPTAEEISYCRPRVASQLNALAPDLIYAFGTAAIAEVLREAPFSPNATSMHGRVVPSAAHGCWVCCGFHPAYFLHEKHKHDGRMDEMLRAGMEKLLEDPYRDQRLDEDRFEIVEDADEVVKRLKALGAGTERIAFDYEATGLDPFDSKWKFLSVAFATSEETGWCVPLEHPHACWTAADLEIIYAALKEWLASPCPKVIQNWQFEELCGLVKFETPTNNVHCCTMVRQHVLDNRRGITSQGFQCFVRYGSTYKTEVDVKNLNREFLDAVARYNVLDARYLIRLAADQDAEMDEDFERAYALFHEAIPQFALMKYRGIRVDVPQLEDLGVETTAKLVELDAAQQCQAVQTYRRKYRRKWDSGSSQDKQKLFFGMLGLKPHHLTPSGSELSNPLHCSTDADSMTHLLGQVEAGGPVAKLIEACQREAHLTKLNGYIKNFLSLTAAGFLHPSFLLHLVSSFRSSSADPNFQNIPVRIEELAQLRRVLVPRFDLLMELDFAGAEVRGYGVHSKDAQLVQNIRDNVDFHRYYASLLYEIPEDEITKEQRYKGKNGFIFPEFYGSYWKTIARNYPEWRVEAVQAAEKELWDQMPGLKQWQLDSEKFYHKHGYLQYLTGFRVRYGKQGCLSFNQVCNMPNQGFAFHRLLRVLLDLEKEMRRRGMKSLIIGQIHDSVVIDCVKDEVPELIKIGQEIVARPAWGYDAIVPWEAEFKTGPNMLDMKEVTL